MHLAMLPRFKTSLLSSLLLLGTLAASAPAPAAAATVEPAVYTQLETDPGTPVWVYLREKADLSGARALPSKADRGRFVLEALQRTAERSQAPLRLELERRGVRFKPYFLVNALLVHADQALVEVLAGRREVARIAPDPKFDMLETPVAESRSLAAAAGIEWNVELVKAPAVWAAGYKGAGVVVGGNDTGVDWDHPAILRQYRGSSDSGVSHDYNWHSAYDARSRAPYDDHDHGTFTVGQMVGDDGNGNQIGIAPEAKWIACKNMDASGFGRPSTYTDCFQWFLAPTDLNGENPRPEMAPDVINNSWSCPREEGCDKNSLHDIVNAVQAAGIMLVFSAGNSGPSCSTVMDPPTTFPEVLSVGATDSSNAIASFSSRGPSAFDRGLKPNVSAPGVSVRSCLSGGGYGSMSGTSMASPEVAGIVALLLSADPSKKGDIEGLSTLLETTATRKSAPRCGGDSTTRSNNTFGYGIVNARAALDALLAGAKRR